MRVVIPLAAFSIITLAGCDSIPKAKEQVREAMEAYEEIKCLTCVNPSYARAVSQPSPCNDYPVEYRVQIPEVDKRSRSVDRYVVTNDVSASYATLNRGCLR
jgi:hypothetical protein